MKISLSNDARNAMVDAVASLIDAGGKAGRIELSTETGALLSVLKFSYPAAGQAASGQLEFNQIFQDASARGSGIAEKAQILDSEGRLVFECDVSDVHGSGVVKLNSNDIRAGGPVFITSFKLSAPRS